MRGRRRQPRIVWQAVITEHHPRYARDLGLYRSEARADEALFGALAGHIERDGWECRAQPNGGLLYTPEHGYGCHATITPRLVR